MGLKEPIQRNFLLSAVTISENLYDSSCFLYITKPRSYRVAKLKITVEKGRPLGGFGWTKSHFRTTASPLSIIPAKKNNKLIRMKYAQKHFESTFGSVCFKQNKKS